MSRVRDCYGLAENGENPGGRHEFGRRHKSWALEEENKLISGTREKLAVGDSAEPKQ
jgi:hypothetical protein